MDKLIDRDRPSLKGERGEAVSLRGYDKKRNRFFAVFLISCALLVSCFAVSAVWTGAAEDWIKGLGSFAGEESDVPTDDTAEATEQTEEGGVGNTESESAEVDATPMGTRVVTRDLSLFEYGAAYIINDSIHTPDLTALLARDVSSAVGEEPLVLILHTHASEGYLEEGTELLEGEIGERTYTDDEKKNVLAVGEALCDTLNASGVPAVHCTVLHDEEGLGGSYARSAESIRFFTALYPSIRYVIDLHRDSILDADGAYVRSECRVEGERVAQVMAVVGSDGNGTPCPAWEENLALALRLRQSLNARFTSLCRPVTLRNASYNQELSARSLLLEIGTGANSVEEAKRTAVLVGEELARLLRSAA